MKIKTMMITVMVFVFASAVYAQESTLKMKDNPKCKQWHSIIGEWTGEYEYRNSPNDNWMKGSRMFEIKWILDGAFAQIHFQNADGITFTSTIGYDPRLETHIGAFFSNTGG